MPPAARLQQRTIKEALQHELNQDPGPACPRMGSGRIPVIFELACKAADQACMGRHNAPKPYVGAIVRALKADEFEAYAQAEHFSVYFTQDREQVRPLPQ